MLNILHENINCRSCTNYNHCKSVEEKYKDELVDLKGNWRSIFDTNGRVGTPTRRCSQAIIQKHLTAFKNKRVLEIGCGPFSPINFEFCQKYNVAYIGIEPERLPQFSHSISIVERIINKIYTVFTKALRIRRHYRNRRQTYILDFFPSPLIERERFDLLYSNSSVEHWHED